MIQLDNISSVELYKLLNILYFSVELFIIIFCSLLGTKSGLLVDHNHTTNIVRGLLCNNCNTALGKFKDNMEILTNAISYISINK